MRPRYLCPLMLNNLDYKAMPRGKYVAKTDVRLHKKGAVKKQSRNDRSSPSGELLVFCEKKGWSRGGTSRMVL